MEEKDKNTTQEPQKPLSIVMTEVKKEIASVINTSGLPIYITELILKDIYNDVVQMSNRIKDMEYQQYAESQMNK